MCRQHVGVQVQVPVQHEHRAHRCVSDEYVCVLEEEEGGHRHLYQLPVGKHQRETKCSPQVSHANSHLHHTAGSSSRTIQVYGFTAGTVGGGRSLAGARSISHAYRSAAMAPYIR